MNSDKINNYYDKLQEVKNKDNDIDARNLLKKLLANIESDIINNNQKEETYYLFKVDKSSILKTYLKTYSILFIIGISIILGSIALFNNMSLYLNISKFVIPRLIGTLAIVKVVSSLVTIVKHPILVKTIKQILRKETMDNLEKQNKELNILKTRVINLDKTIKNSGISVFQKNREIRDYNEKRIILERLQVLYKTMPHNEDYNLLKNTIYILNTLYSNQKIQMTVKEEMECQTKINDIWNILIDLDNKYYKKEKKLIRKKGKHEKES